MNSTGFRIVARRAVLALAIPAFAAATPARAQDAADDYELVASDAASGEPVAVLVSGWHAVTGEEMDVGAAGASDGLVAVTGDAFVRAVSERGSVSDVRRFENLPLIAMRMDAEALRAARDHGGDVRVWKDRPVRLLLSESVGMVGADRAHRSGRTGKGAFVAVIDTGVDVGHPFISGRRILEACFADRCPNGRRRMVGRGAARPVHSHGTHVAGIALGRGRDVSGVAPEAGLIAINVFNRNGGARNSHILAALDWLIRVAYDRRAGVRIAAINMSLGGNRHFRQPCADRFYRLAARYLGRRGAVIVAAAGNESNARGISHPACVRGIVSVGAVDKRSRVARFSNSAPILDLLAPGVDILSAVPRTRGRRAPFKEFPGTSMAAPHVAGALAVLRAAAPRQSPRDLYRALVRGGRTVRDGRNGIRKPALNLAGALSVLGRRTDDRESDGTGETGGAGVPTDSQGEWTPVGE